jgi:hypothetical protein
MTTQRRYAEIHMTESEDRAIIEWLGDRGCPPVGVQKGADGLTYVEITERIGLSRTFITTEIVAAHLISMTDAARLPATCHDLPDKEQRWSSPSARPTS